MNYLLLLFVLVFSANLHAQVGIGISDPHSSSMLDISSNSRGLLPPRLASHDLINDPAPGLVIYDLSDKCLNVFNGDDWVNLCELDGGGGSSSTGVNTPTAGVSDYTWATPLRFSQIMTPRIGSNNSMVTATSLDSNAYVWGEEVRQLIRNWKPTTSSFSNTSGSLPTSGIDKYLISPQRLNDSAFNGKVKAFYNSDDLYAIHTHDGEVYTFGNAVNQLQSVSLSGTNYLTKTRKMTLPAASSGETIEDIKISLRCFYILTSDGKVYWKGNSLGGLTSSASWREIAKPAGVPSTFEYTEILNKENTVGGQIFMKGSDDNIYAAGSNATLFGVNYNSSTTNPTQSSGIVRLDFPAGVNQKIVRIKDQNKHAAAITDDGEIYAWGNYSGNSGATLAFKIDPSAPTPTLFTSSSKKYIKTPTKVALPTGETSLRDIDFDNIGNFDRPTFLVGGSGKVYIIGGDDDQEFLVAPNAEPSMEYTELWSANRVFAKEVHLNGNTFSYLDEGGQFFHHGDVSVTGGFNSIHGTNSFVSPFALPVTDGALDSTNPNP